MSVVWAIALGPISGLPATPDRDGGMDRADRIEPSPRLDPDHFRCVVVGDSQTTGPNSNRIRTQFHRWDASTVGAQLVVGNGSAGYLVNNGNAGNPLLGYQLVDVNNGWSNGGPNDFFAVKGHEWSVAGDLDMPFSRVGRFRVRFGPGNNEAPWSQPWGVGATLRARVAVRTSPISVPAVELRAERDGALSSSGRSVHELSDQWGVQIIEQDIPVDFNPKGTDVGIGLFFPDGYEEQSGQVLQVLGVVIERVDANGHRMNGTLIGYQGRGGWNIADHINHLSQASRAALIELTDADHVMIMLAHNQEPGGESEVEPNLRLLVSLWEQSYSNLGRPRPKFVFVVPWTIFVQTASDYLLEVERAMGELAGEQRRDLLVNYLPLHNYLRPDIYDPDRYTLDPAVHPGDIPTAVNLSEDLYQMLFEGRRE